MPLPSGIGRPPVGSFGGGGGGVGSVLTVIGSVSGIGRPPVGCMLVFPLVEVPDEILPVHWYVPRGDFRPRPEGRFPRPVPADQLVPNRARSNPA